MKVAINRIKTWWYYDYDSSILLQLHRRDQVKVALNRIKIWWHYDY